MMKLFVLTALLAATSSQAAPAFVAGPYQYLPLARHEATLPAAGTATWAFATGECGREVWRGQSGSQVAAANVARFVQAGRPYIVSTGGAEAIFTCASSAGMDRFVQRYLSPQLVGFDFDIEDKQTPAQVDSLLRQIRRTQRRHPRLRYSFTIATHAASDGSLRSLNPLGDSIHAAIRKHGVQGAVYNLMVMNYGEALPANCVVREGRCDMGASSLQAARNVHAKYGIPYRQIALTAMIGMNDVVANVFTPDDARTLMEGARALGLAGVHYWSLDRDKPCAAPTAVADGSCSSTDAPAGVYTGLLSADR